MRWRGGIVWEADEAELLGWGWWVGGVRLGILGFLVGMGGSLGKAVEGFMGVGNAVPCWKGV